MFDVGRSMFDVRFFPEIEPPLLLGGCVGEGMLFFHSKFDVGRSMFDVRFFWFQGSSDFHAAETRRQASLSPVEGVFV
jgi:hypothetical protein